MFSKVEKQKSITHCVVEEDDINYLEKLFHQHPLIYCIGGEYYAFGSGICAKCDTDSGFLESIYTSFIENKEKNMSQKDA